MEMCTVALAGNPNSGKTTLFNALTGSRHSVGNWPGVTVEKKHGKVKVNKNIEDLWSNISYFDDKVGWIQSSAIGEIEE